MSSKIKSPYSKLMSALSRHPALLISALAGLVLPIPVRAIDMMDVIFNLGPGMAVGMFFSMISSALTAVSWLLSLLLGMLVALIGWVIQVMLVLNMNIVNSAAVQTGFPVILSIANLAFVLGIIVIAIATILRMESYGMKRILIWLILMAVLVNFGLIMAGVILNFSDSFTMYFVQTISPSSTEEALALTTPAGAIYVMGDFASAVAGAFNPQINFLWNAATSGDLDQIAGALGAGSQDSQGLVTVITGLLMSVISLLVIIIVLATFVAMLLYRYVKLSLLLVMLPLAWAAYAFPGTKSYFSKWWDSFLKQAFFPPIVIFFLWLALKTAESMGTSGSHEYEAISANGDLKSFAEARLSDMFAGNLENLVKMFILGSIMMGGLVAAQKFGAKFADSAEKGIEGVKHFGSKQAGRVGKRGAAAAWQRAGMDKRAKTMEATKGSWLGNPLGKLTSLTGRYLNKASKPFTKGLVKEAAKDVESMGTKELVNALKGGSFSIEQQLAAIEKLLKDGNAHLIESINGMSLAQFMETNGESAFKRYGQGGVFDELEDKAGMTKGLRQALIELQAAQRESDAMEDQELPRLAKAQEGLTLALQALAKSKDAETIAKFIVTKPGFDFLKEKGRSILGLPPETIRDMTLGIFSGILQTTPERASKAIGKMDTYEKDALKDYIVAMAARDHGGEVKSFMRSLPDDMREYLEDSPAAQRLGLTTENLNKWKAKGRKGVGEWETPEHPIGAANLEGRGAPQEPDYPAGVTD